MLASVRSSHALNELGKVAWLPRNKGQFTDPECQGDRFSKDLRRQVAARGIAREVEDPAHLARHLILL